VVVCCLLHSLTYGLSMTGFERPSSIQSKGIVPFGKGLDVIQQAQSGTGKTATFCAGILQSLDFNLNECQALVLAPTRELAQQIEKVMRALGDYLQVRSMMTIMLVVLCVELVSGARCWLPALLLCSRPARLADRMCDRP
jgi:superfamily II DNA/RNA helicase